MDFEIIKRLVVAKLLKEQSEKKLEDEPDEDSTEDTGEEMAPEQSADTEEKEKEEYPPKDAKNVVDVSGEAGFCDYQPKITEYALSSPENMTEVLIFCIASQQVDWINIYTRFPHLINWLYNYNGMFPKDAQVVDDRLIGGFPSEFSPIVMGKKAKNIDTAWTDRDNTYSLIAPIMRRYLRASGEKRKEIAFELYIHLLDYVHLGIPKAGFAMQLLIGSYACVDSINKLTLEVPMPEELFTMTKEGELVFKPYGKKSIPGSAFGNSSLNLKMHLGGLYKKFTEEVGELANDDESKVFWDGWVTIVSAKVNYRGEKIHLVDPRKPRIYKNMSIKSDYKKYSQGVPSTFPKGMQTPRDISRQHASVMRGLRNITEAQMFALIKKAIKQKLMESSVMGAGAVEVGMAKPEDKLIEKKKLTIKRKLSEKMDPATDPRYPVAHTVGLGRAGTGATGLEEELDEDVIVEYLTEEEAKKNPPLGKVRRNPSGSKKKFHVYVRCSGKIKKISFGDPNLSIKRDSPERRKSFRARHKCDKPEGKNRCTARYWACMTWRRGTSVSDMTKEE